MNKFLKGNYVVKIKRPKKSKARNKNITELFESKALEKLGGSIAFVMKSDKFIWTEDEKAQ